jgi:Glycosyl transferases group 1
MSKHLLLLNYTLSSKHPVLSHQLSIFERLSKHYSQITVITGDKGDTTRFPTARIIDLSWSKHWKFISLMRLLICFIYTLLHDKPDVVFSHMTDVYSAFTAPISRILKVPHFLWYAHKHKSVYLRIAFPFLTGVITSTEGSIPIKSKKVQIIGQSIDENRFYRELKPSSIRLQKGVHLGRFSKSKNLGLIVSFLRQISSEHKKISITLVGLEGENNSIARALTDSNIDLIQMNILLIQKAIDRDNVPQLLPQFDFFIHAYKGSLDKTLLEATMMGLPVITLNEEYIKIFGNWNSNCERPSLTQQYYYLKGIPSEKLLMELRRRQIICLQDHSLSGWIDRLVKVLECESS